MKLGSLLLLITGCTLFISCGRSADRHGEDGNFVVYATDTDFSATRLGFNFNPGTLGIVESEVVAAGSDSTYVVVERINHDNLDREYYIITKEKPDHHSGNADGPYTAEEYQKLKSSRSLPEFSWKK